jgi:hypothetical protein
VSPCLPPVKVVLDRIIANLDTVVRDRDFILKLKEDKFLPRGTPLPSQLPPVETAKMTLAATLSTAPPVGDGRSGGLLVPTVAPIARPLSPPWLEHGSSEELEHNRSNKILAWKERSLLLQHAHDDGWSRAKVVHAVMRQEGVRQRVVDFCLSKSLGHLQNDPKAVQFKAAPTINANVLHGNKKLPHEWVERHKDAMVLKTKDKVRAFNGLKVKTKPRPTPVDSD